MHREEEVKEKNRTNERGLTIYICDKETHKKVIAARTHTTQARGH